MRVSVLRVTGMPFGTQLWVVDEPARFQMFVDADLITEPGAVLLEQVMNMNASNWRRIATPREPNTSQAAG